MVKSNIFRQFINDCNMPNVARDVCPFLRTCEIAVLSTNLVSFELVFKKNCFVTQLLNLSRQNEIYRKSLRKKENES